jgi:hypothetical protein
MRRTQGHTDTSFLLQVSLEDNLRSTRPAHGEAIPSSVVNCVGGHVCSTMRREKESERTRWHPCMPRRNYQLGNKVPPTPCLPHLVTELVVPTRHTWMPPRSLSLSNELINSAFNRRRYPLLHYCTIASLASVDSTLLLPSLSDQVWKRVAKRKNEWQNTR